MTDDIEERIINDIKSLENSLGDLYRLVIELTDRVTKLENSFEW